MLRWINTSGRLALSAAALVLGLGACEWPWPYDDPDDPFRCDPACDGKAGEFCVEGQCVVVDAGIFRGDGPRPKCGDKKCDPGETSTSCPRDCEKCTNGAQKCADGIRLKQCKNSSWVTRHCKDICVEAGYGRALACGTSGITQVCICGGGFGDSCSPTNNTKPCGASFKCLRLSTLQAGFCSKPCNTLGAECTGGPTGFKALCALKVTGTTPPPYYCAFVCTTDKDCPTNLFFCDAKTCKPK